MEFAKRLEKVLEASRGILLSKRQRYGQRNIKDGKQVLSRLGDKIARLEQHYVNGVDLGTETVYDTWIDAANYALIGLLLECNAWFDNDNLADFSKLPLPEAVENVKGADGETKTGVVRPFDPPSPIHGKFVYLAGPIDNATRGDAVEWREEAAKLLGQHNIASYTPAGAFGYPHSCGEAVRAINDAAIRACHVLLVRLPANICTIGTIIEMIAANALGKSIVLCTDIPKSIDLERLNYVRFALSEIDEAVQYIAKS